VTPLIQVFDLPTSLRFYQQLGFSILQQTPGWAWLRREESELMLNTLYDPDDARPASLDASRFEAHGDTGLYLGCPDVDAMHASLLELGIAHAPPRVAPYGMKQLYLRDPDGYTICFQWKA
jgi:glyoxylase I family protein